MGKLEALGAAMRRLPLSSHRYSALKKFNRLAKVWDTSAWLSVLGEIIKIIEALSVWAPSVKPADGRVKRVLRKRADLQRRKGKFATKSYRGKRCANAKLQSTRMRTAQAQRLRRERDELCETRTEGEEKTASVTTLRAAWDRWGFKARRVLPPCAGATKLPHQATLASFGFQPH